MPFAVIRESIERELGKPLDALFQSLDETPMAAATIAQTVDGLTTRGILVEEFSPGERVDLYADAHPEEKKRLARSVALLAMHQVFETGLFHADPIPGTCSSFAMGVCVCMTLA